MASEYPAQTPTTYKSPLLAGEDFQFVSAYTIFPYDNKYMPTVFSEFQETYTLEITAPDGEIFTETFNRYISSSNGLPPQRVRTTGTNNGINIKLKSGIYLVEYKFNFTYPIGTPQEYTARYTFQAVQNQYPLKPLTVKETVIRDILLAEPLTFVPGKGLVKQPRFKFGYKYPIYEYPNGTKQKQDENGKYLWDEDGSPIMDGEPLKDEAGNPIPNESGVSERKLFAKTAPEFTFTNMNLREQLQLVGQFIHAEPRLLHFDTWIFDRYGEQKLATYVENGTGQVKPLNQHPFKYKRYVQSANTACTSIESNVDNFVNRLDGIGGTIAEPYRGGAISLRTDTAYIRNEDAEGRMYFPTTEPVMDVTSFVWVDLEGIAGTAGKRYDITPYVFEKTIYDANLSSYEKQYPRSKCYGLYFTQGQKHLQSFFFKNEEWSGGIFAQYAILNILREATGNGSFTIPSYPRLCFELVYTPIYGARVAHGKSYLGDTLEKPFSLTYNQGANVIETRYYGEHLKGVAERFGNVEQTVELVMQNVNNIPKIGEKWDDDYYISSVSVTALSACFIVEVSLTKKFNRLSEYVGANSYKRYYEVSERMAQERRTLYRDYYVITQKESDGIPDDCFARKQSLGSVANTFYQTTDNTNISVSGTLVSVVKDIASCVFVTGFSKKLDQQASVALPVTSSALGNVMEYTWSFKDNYSAGIASSFQTEGEVSGYFGAEVPYGDYYGRIYYELFDLDTQASHTNITVQEALNLPRRNRDNVSDVGFTTQIGQNSWSYMVINKDSSEILSQAYSVEFVTDMKNIVIGSALARNNPTIGGLKQEAKAALYILQERVNPFSNDELDLTNATKVYEYDSDFDILLPISRQIRILGGDTAPYLSFQGIAATVAGKAWAIVTAQYEGEPYTVENEDGEEELFTPKYGGEVLIAQNGDFAAGDIIGKFNIVPTHDIFEFKKKQEA